MDPVKLKQIESLNQHGPKIHTVQMTWVGPGASTSSCFLYLLLVLFIVTCTDAFDDVCLFFFGQVQGGFCDTLCITYTYIVQFQSDQDMEECPLALGICILNSPVLS